MIKTFTGPMHSGKSSSMLREYFKIWNKEHIICFKPKIDNRDLGVIKSKSFNKSIEAICINNFEDILPYINDSIKNIFIDEVQFIKGNVNILNYLSLAYDINIYVAGLNITSDLKGFLCMPQILAISDEIEIIKASCYDCGKDASYTYYEGKKDNDIKVGDDNYYPLCANCYRKRVGNDELNNYFSNLFEIRK